MKVQLNPGTRISLPDGTPSDYGALVEVDEDTGRLLTTGPNPSGTALHEAGEKPAPRKKEK